MTVVISILAVATLLLLVTVFGLMRELLIVRADVQALSTLITNPPTPTYLGEQAPRPLVEVLRIDDVGISRVVLFLSDTCPSCRDLTREITARQANAAWLASALLVVVNKSGRKSLGLDDLRCRVVEDHRGDLHRACELRGVPGALAISQQSGIVLDYAVGPSPDWVIRYLTTSSDDDGAPSGAPEPAWLRQS